MRVRRLGTAEATLPAYQSDDAAGCDLVAALDAPMVLEPGRRALVPTGTPTYEGSTPQCRCFPGP